MAQVKALFFLPIHDNDGRELGTERSELEDQLYLRFLAWTKLGIVQGAYRLADGTKSVDEHQAYAVLIDEILLADVEDMIRGFKGSHFKVAFWPR